MIITFTLKSIVKSVAQNSKNTALSFDLVTHCQASEKFFLAFGNFAQKVFLLRKHRVLIVRKW
jgi:hypothetical protein